MEGDRFTVAVNEGFVHHANVECRVQRLEEKEVEYLFKSKFRLVLSLFGRNNSQTS